MTHGSNVLGTVQVIGEIGNLLRSRDIFFVVDGAQTAGQVPVDLGSLPVDLFAYTGHKALFGIPGIGGFFIQDPARVDPERFEAGTHNYPGMASLSAGLRFLGQKGIGNIGKVTMDMTRFLIGRLKETGSISLDNENPDLPIISLNVDGMEPDKVGFILARIYGIICRTGLHCAPLVHRRINGGRGSVRLSLSCMNTMEECGVVADALTEVARSAG